MSQQKKNWFPWKTNKIDKTLPKMDLKFYINN